MLAVFLCSSFLAANSYAQFTDFNQHDPGINSEIPPWIKNTAGWWATDAISESEFLRAIEYFVEKKIIKISATQSDPLDISKIFTIPEGRDSEFVQFSGTYTEKHEGPLTLTIILPDRSEQTLTTVARDGAFTATMELTTESQIGRYKVFAEIEGNQVPVSAFDVRDQSANKVPLWIKNNALWWSEDKITDSDFVQGIEFLVEKKIIRVETPAPKPPQEPSDPHCEGDARCLSGRVTEITDGDTIEVNGQPIRFALASAPEIDQPEGLEAQAFIESICPKGNMILVDEDDGQTQGSHGRIIAVVYCLGKNLNKELLEANLGYLSAEFCQTSEFAQTMWAQKHGCSPESEQTGKTLPTSCDASYPDVCIPSPPPDLDCSDIEYRNFEVLQPDPHRFDGNYDGVGCEK